MRELGADGVWCRHLQRPRRAKSRLVPLERSRDGTKTNANAMRRRDKSVHCGVCLRCTRLSRRTTAFSFRGSMQCGGCRSAAVWCTMCSTSASVEARVCWKRCAGSQWPMLALQRRPPRHRRCAQQAVPVAAKQCVSSQLTTSSQALLRSTAALKQWALVATAPKCGVATRRSSSTGTGPRCSQLPPLMPAANSAMHHTLGSTKRTLFALIRGRRDTVVRSSMTARATTRSSAMRKWSSERHRHQQSCATRPARCRRRTARSPRRERSSAYCGLRRCGSSSSGFFAPTGGCCDWSPMSPHSPRRRGCCLRRRAMVSGGSWGRMK